MIGLLWTHGSEPKFPAEEEVDMAKLYSQVIGVVLVVVGILGFLMPGIGTLLQFHAHHNLIHLISGLALAYFGFMGNENGQRMAAKIFGIIYGLVTVLGVFGMENLGPIMLNLNWTYNIIHLVIGGWGLWAGFAKVPAPATAS
jgi:hypothetical protein